MNSVLQAALKYHSFGWSVIPIPKGQKFPAIPWKEYQGRLPTLQEIYKWFCDPNQSIGIITGPLSNLSVWDVDKDSPSLSHVAVKTPHGCHSYFRYDERVKTLQEVQSDTDTRSKGGLVVAPPSEGYSWVNPIFSPKDLPPFPESFGQCGPANVQVPIRNRPGYISEILTNLSDGTPRTPRLLKVIGRMHFDRYTADDIYALIAPYAEPAGYDSKRLRDKINEITTSYQNERSGEGPKIHTPASSWEEFTIYKRDLGTRRYPEIQSGFATLDKHLFGFRRGELYTIGARTGTGKTSFCINVARTLLGAGKRVLFLSTEMSYLSIWHRLQIDDASFRDAPLYASDISSPNRTQIEGLVNETNPDVLIFDHVQHIGTIGNNRYQELSAFVKTLKDIARRFNISVLCASQLNRSADFPDKQGVKPKPALYHLKECGTIEEESTAVMLLSKDQALDDHTDAYTLSLQKNRFGLCQDIPISFNKVTGVMKEL